MPPAPDPTPSAARVLVAHPSADHYGSDLQLVESVAGLRAAGWGVVLHVPERGPLLERLPDVEHVVAPFVVLRKSLLRPLALLLLLVRVPLDVARLVRYVRRYAPDVVYVNTVTIPTWIVAARLARVPVLVHVHEAEGADSDVPRPVRVLLVLPLLLARSIVANSRASADVLADALPRLRRTTTIVHNGVPDRGPGRGADVVPGRVAVVARLSPRKGIDVALDAVALLRRDGRDVTLDVCGTAFAGYEWFEQQLRRRAERSDLAGAVEFLGYVNPTTTVLARAQVVVAPSRVEPFGNTAVEALLARRPLVASKVQGLAEIVTDDVTGLLVAPGDASALAGAIARLLDEPELASALAEAGRHAAVTRFGTDTYRDAIVGAVTALTREAAA